MRITYAQNPLRTTVELDGQEKKELWYKIKLKEYEDIIFEAHFYLGEKYFDVKRVRRIVKPNEVNFVDNRVNELFECYISELMNRHAGDCTCIPCSCEKCHVEGMLGIDTIKGLDKHAAYNINLAFGDNSKRTLDEAIEHLAANVVPTKSIEWERHTQEEFDSYLPGWAADSNRALEWLTKYRNTHFTEFKWRT